MLQKIDRYLNNTTMYRLVLVGLEFLAACSIVLAFSGTLHHGGMAYIISLLIIVVTSFVSNFLFAKLFDAPINIESWIITAFILYFILFPSVSLADAVTAAIASVVAMGSKYFLTINRRHIFNPVAVGAFAIGAASLFVNAIPNASDYFNAGNAVWWVGTPAMFLPVLLVGLLVVRKIRKFGMFLAFVIGSIITTALLNFTEQGSLLQFVDSTKQLFFSWPLIFFGSIMLTEPFTMPPHRRVQIIFGFAVGLLFSARYHFGPIYSTPELALIIGNLFAFAVSLKRRLMLTLKEKKLISKDTYEFSFTSDAPLHFSAGQYLEWTLPLKSFDNRGNRRYFTIASSPTEKELKLGVKFYQPSSAFKTNLLALPEGNMIAAGQLGGDFVLPHNLSKKLVLIAGGIGVTPFRSMVKYLIDKKEKREVILFYSVKSEDEIAYRDIFDRAEREIGLKVVYMVGNFLTAEDIKKETGNNPLEYTYYMSGPNVMVENYKKLIRSLGVSRSRIKTDYFPGF